MALRTATARVLGAFAVGSYGPPAGKQFCGVVRLINLQVDRTPITVTINTAIDVYNLEPSGVKGSSVSIMVELAPGEFVNATGDFGASYIFNVQGDERTI